MKTYQIADATLEPGEDSLTVDGEVLEFDTREAAEEKIAELNDEKYSVKVIYPVQPVNENAGDTDGGV